MAAYSINAIETEAGALLRVKFADAATGECVMADAAKALDALILPGGKLARVNGPASLPVAAAIGHKLAHLYGAVAFFDPKLQGYIVAISHDPALPVGMVLEG